MPVLPSKYLHHAFHVRYCHAWDPNHLNHNVVETLILGLNHHTLCLINAPHGIERKIIRLVCAQMEAYAQKLYRGKEKTKMKNNKTRGFTYNA
jgi:hypothetical protein